MKSERKTWSSCAPGGQSLQPDSLKGPDVAELSGHGGTICTEIMLPLVSKIESKIMPLLEKGMKKGVILKSDAASGGERSSPFA